MDSYSLFVYRKPRHYGGVQKSLTDEQDTKSSDCVKIKTIYQLKVDKESDQISMFASRDPYTGSKQEGAWLAWHQSALVRSQKRLGLYPKMKCPPTQPVGISFNLSVKILTHIFNVHSQITQSSLFFILLLT